MATAGGPSLAALVLLWCALLHTTGAVRESALGHSLGVFPDADVPEEAGDSVSLDPDDPADEAEEEVSLADCQQLQEEEKRREDAFQGGVTHLISAQQRVHRLRLRLPGEEGDRRGLTLLVEELHQRLQVLETASQRYGERLKKHLEQLKGERCKNSNVAVDDLGKEVLSAEKRRAATLKALTREVQQRTAEYEDTRLEQQTPKVDDEVISELYPENDADEDNAETNAPAPEHAEKEQLEAQAAENLTDVQKENHTTNRTAQEAVQKELKAVQLVGSSKSIGDEQVFNESNTSNASEVLNSSNDTEVNDTNESNFSAAVFEQAHALVNVSAVSEASEDYHQQLMGELDRCGSQNVKDATLSNNPLRFTLKCFFQAPMIRCSPWIFDPKQHDGWFKETWITDQKVRLQSFWILALFVVLLLFFVFSVYREQMKKHTKEALGKRSKEELQAMEERALASSFDDLMGCVVDSSKVMIVVDVLTALIPISNIVLYALATEDVAEADERSVVSSSMVELCANWHDTWMFGSICVLIVFQVVRAVAAMGHHPYCVYGRWAWLMYLGTDISSMGDTVAILLSGWSLLCCRAVRWNWMIFSFIRVIESLGRWGLGVNFYGFSQEVQEDRRMIYALAVFGLVIWVLIGSLYYVVNSTNSASQWEYVGVIKYTDGVKTQSQWQRFESIPSSMFFALLTLNKKNPLAHVFVTWYEKLLVIFVNICCVPLFSLVSSMIGGSIMKLVLSEAPPAEGAREQPSEAAGDEVAELEDDEEEEEEEEEEVEEEVAEDAPPSAEVPLWQQWKDFYQSLTWEQHWHPAVMALLGFGSVFCYGLSTSKREMKWLFFTVHKLPHWAFPAVDGVVGALFLADWLHSAVSPAAEVPPQEDAAVADAEAELAQPEAERTVVVVEADRGMSLWRHVAYFLSSVPGIVNLLLCVLEVAFGPLEGEEARRFNCLCCLWRIYLLEKWLDHPFQSALDALHTCRKQLVTTGAVTIFFWLLGAHLLFFTEFENPDKYIRKFYGSVLRAIWVTSFFLNGEWVFCDFSWMGKAVGGFIVLFGVSIVVVPMTVFTGYFLMNIQGDFYETQVQYLKAEPGDLWQLKMQPSAEAYEWQKKLFKLLYEHLQQLDASMRAKSKDAQSIGSNRLSRPFVLFKWASITASLLFTLVTVLENSEYMNTDLCDHQAHLEGLKTLFKGDPAQRLAQCKAFFGQVDTIEYTVDLVFLHFFLWELILRTVALGWRHLISELGLAEILSITGLVASLTLHPTANGLSNPSAAVLPECLRRTNLQEAALHHPEQHRHRLWLGSIIFLRLTRLVSIGSYFGLLRAFRKVIWITRWSLLKSFYFLVAVWFTHAMLLHFAEAHNETRALAGAQILPSGRPHHPHSKVAPTSLLENTSLNVSTILSDINVSGHMGNVTNITNHSVDYESYNISSGPKLLWPEIKMQKERFGDYLNAMQYSLVHLTGDYPIVQYSITGKVVLLVGLIVGTCATAVWTAVFSSSMVNYLANEAEDLLSKAAERRMLLAIEVVLRLQRQWRRRKRRREAARAAAEAAGDDPDAAVAAAESSEPSEMERRRLSWRGKARRLALRHTVWGQRLMQFFQGTLLFNVVMKMIFSLPEFEETDFQTVDQRIEIVCTVIFTLELLLMLLAGKGRQGHRWYLFRAVDFICLIPGIVEVYQIREHWHEIHQIDQGKLEAKEEEWIQDMNILLSAFQMIRVIRVLFWHQWRNEVQVVIDGIASAGPILVVPAFLSFYIWIMVSALFLWMENVYDGPSKEFFTSISTTMYWTSSFLIGEWTLADFSEGGGNRVCIFVVLFGIMCFGIATGILMEGVQQSITVAMMENTSFQDLAQIAQDDPKAGKNEETRRAPRGMSNKQEALRRAAKVAAMTQQMAERKPTATPPGGTPGRTSDPKTAAAALDSTS